MLKGTESNDGEAQPVTLGADLYNFDKVMLNTFMTHEPVYVSPKSQHQMSISSVTECDDPKYDPFDADCPNVKKKIHPKIVPEPPVPRLYRYGRTIGELLWGSGLCLIKEEWVPRIEPEGFSGLEFRPVDLFQDERCKKPLSGYVEMRASARVPIDLERSGVKVQYACPFCGFTRYSSWKQEKGLHFVSGVDEWPDVFMPEQQVVAAIMVKRRFAQLMVDLEIRPFMLVRREDMKAYKPFPDWSS